MLPGKRDFYRCCKARRSATYVNKEFWQQFQNYAPPSLRVIRTKIARTIIYILEKWFPFQGERAHSLLLFLYMLIERRRRRGDTEQFSKGCNILHRLQVYHLTLTFILHNKYTSTLYLYTYMHIPIITIVLIRMPFIDRINVRYKLLGTYI